MTVYDNVGFGLKVRKWPKDEIRERVDELLSLVQLDGLADRYPRSSPAASGSGWRWRARSRSQPQVLLLDEPFGALDAKVRKELRDWLRRLHEEMHVTTIFVTHDQEEAMDVADQLVVMNQGGSSRRAPRTSSTSSPRNEFVMSFVGEVNRLGDALRAPARHRDRRRPGRRTPRRRWCAASCTRLRDPRRAGARRRQRGLGAADPRDAAASWS